MTAAATRLACVVLALLIFGGCKDEPKEAYERLVFHARMNNETAFLEGFTPQSRRIIKSLLELRRTYGDLVQRDADPYLSLVLEDVEDVEIESIERASPDGKGMIDTKMATLTVTDGKIIRKIQMIETEEGWKIDALDLQTFWSENRQAFVDR
ncbi:MAG: hypothetical protein ACI9WU_003076 [Myxococcota bacterium]